MKQRQLGKTGLRVSELALGGVFTSSLGKGLQETKQMIRRCIELGINYIDTAPAYADSEKMVGKALKEIGADAKNIVVSTKLGGRPEPFDPQDRKALLRSVEESRKFLGIEVIDILMIHEPDRPLQYNWWTNPQTCDGPVMEVLEKLKKEGVIRFTGLGGTTVAELSHFVRSGRFEVVLTAFNYNALFREAEHEVLPAAQTLGMGIVIGSTLGQGALGRRYDDVIRSKPIWLSRPRQQQMLALYRFLDELGMSLPELSIRFVLSNTEISCVLVGPKTAEQVQESVTFAEKGPLPAEVLHQLDNIAAMVPFRPFEEPMILPFNKHYYGPGMARLGW